MYLVKILGQNYKHEYPLISAYLILCTDAILFDFQLIKEN